MNLSYPGKAQDKQLITTAKTLFQVTKDLLPEKRP